MNIKSVSSNIVVNNYLKNKSDVKKVQQVQKLIKQTK